MSDAKTIWKRYRNKGQDIKIQPNQEVLLF